MNISSAVLILSFTIPGSIQVARPVEVAASPEARIVSHIKTVVDSGQRIVVSQLTQEVFTSETDRRALNRLFNTFFKMPLYIVQAQKAKGLPPTLKELSEQFAFTEPGTANVLLRVMETDPRVPRFMERDPKTGEILKVDPAAIVAHPRFGTILERTIAGWEGAKAPDFTATSYEGSELSLKTLSGQPFLLYFWFTNCPPCVTTSPMLVELDAAYRPKGFKVVALNADRLLELDYTDADRAEYAKKLGIRFSLGHLTSEAQIAYGGVSVFPTMFFVDRTGVVVKHLVNAQSKEALKDAFERALR